MYTISIPLDVPPHERILSVKASPSPGKAPDRSGPPGSGGPGYPPSPGIKEIRFSEDDPIEEERGDEVSREFFEEHEDRIVERIFEAEAMKLQR